MTVPNSAGAILALAAAGVVLMTAGAGVASAAPERSRPHSVPTSRISVQLYTFVDYVITGPKEGTRARLENVLRRLRRTGYRNVEPFTFHDLTARQFRALLDKHHLEAPVEHVSIEAGTWAKTLADAKTIGARYLGAGGTPSNLTADQQWIDYAGMLNRRGRSAHRRGLRLFVHAHNWDFARTTGGRRGFDILMQHTDPRYVFFQLDLYWAVAGGADPVRLIKRYGDRIQLFHVKDRGVGGRIEIVGEGDIDFPPVFKAAGGAIRYYAVEHDPREDDPSFDPFEAAQKGFAYLDRVRF